MIRRVHESANANLQSPPVSHSSRVLRIILLVSCAHALVHLLEQSIASVEQVISSDYSLDMEQSGLLGFALRLPYGIGALFAGLLADRFGEKRILVLYLSGAALVCLSFPLTANARAVYVQLFSLGAFASMYHPAGLALLANQTRPAERARALGVHGIFGSLGIASAPFIAGLMLTVRPGDWRGYYVLLAVVSGTLALLVWLLLKPEKPEAVQAEARRVALLTGAQPGVTHELSFQFIPYALLVLGAGAAGAIYGGVLHFLPRYLKEAGVLALLGDLDDAAIGNYAAAIALACGAFGQWTAGRLATPSRLPGLLALVYASNIPFLIWMTWAEGTTRLVAACLWAFFHFMNQPLYNSLIPEFIPPRRRSVGFGFSNMMGFGVGAIGPYFVGKFDDRFQDYTIGYSALAILALIAAILPLPLLVHRFSTREHNRGN